MGAIFLDKQKASGGCLWSIKTQIHITNIMYDNSGSCKYYVQLVVQLLMQFSKVLLQ